MQALDSVFLLKSKERFKSHTHDVHFLGHFCLYNIWGFIHWQIVLRQMYIRYKEAQQLCSWFRFYWFCPHSLQALSKVSVEHLLAVVRVKRGQILPVKTTLFLFFCRSEMYSYHRNNIATIWHMQGKLTTILMQQFFPLFKCSRKNQTRVWLKCYLLHKMHFKNLWFVLLKNKFMLSRIHINGGSSIAGLGNMWGGGFVFLKHYRHQCVCWLDYVASYPLTILQFQRFCFPC